MEPNQNWIDQLRSQSNDQQVAALREIAGAGPATGVTTDVVLLAGSSNDEVSTWAAEALESAIEPSPSDADGLISLLQQCGDGEVCNDYPMKP